MCILALQLIDTSGFLLMKVCGCSSPQAGVYGLLHFGRAVAEKVFSHRENNIHHLQIVTD
jgi:hypothetical protein